LHAPDDGPAPSNVNEVKTALLKPSNHSDRLTIQLLHPAENGFDILSRFSTDSPSLISSLYRISAPPASALDTMRLSQKENCHVSLNSDALNIKALSTTTYSVFGVEGPYYLLNA
jgi:hypothetical protein